MKIKINNILVLLAIIIVEVLFFRMSSIRDSNIPQIVMIIANTIFISVYLSLIYKNSHAKARTIIIISLIIRTALLFFDIYTGKGIFTGSDTESFYETATGTSSILIGNHYVKLLKGLIAVLGSNRLMLQYINILASLISMITLYKILNMVSKDEKKINIGMALFCLGPINMMLSASLLREPIMIALNVLSLYFFISWYKNNTKQHFALSIVLILASSWLHSGMVLLLLGYFVAFILYSPTNKRISFRKNTITYLILVSILLLGIYIYLGSSITKYFNRLETIEDASINMSTGNTSYLLFLNNSSLPIMLLFTPIKIIYFFLSPMIWDVRNLSQLLVALFSASIYLILFIKSIKDTKTNKSLFKLLLFFFLITSITYAWGVNNAGTAMRHREKILPIIVTMYCITENKNKNNKLKRID